nr:hypothetical protein TLHOJNLA_TLHOJNLA_CDS_0005 [Microvirus sp.]
MFWFIAYKCPFNVLLLILIYFCPPFGFGCRQTPPLDSSLQKSHYCILCYTYFYIYVNLLLNLLLNISLILFFFLLLPCD